MHLVKKDKGYKVIPPMAKIYSKGEFERLGNRLREYYKNKTIIPDTDLDILSAFRASYKKHLSQIFDILNTCAIKVDKGSIVTYRIKRIDSIMSKLERMPGTILHRIEDIAGCRCILSNNDQVYQLKQLLSNELYIRSDRNDYIQNPKPDGYKSLHLIVQTKDRTSPLIEIQIRCVRDHNWATLVEITDQIYKTKIKEGVEHKELGQLLLYLSKERTSLSMKDLVDLFELVNKTEFIKRISSVFVQNSVNSREKWNEINKTSSLSFYLIQVDDSNNSFINKYSTFDEAETNYFKAFAKYPSRNIVLTRIKNATYKQLSKAYSNYTLSYHETITEIQTYMRDIIKDAMESGNVFKFNKYFSLYVYTHFEVSAVRANESILMTRSNCHHSIKAEWLQDLKSDLKKFMTNAHEIVNPAINQKKTIPQIIMRFIAKYVLKRNAKRFHNYIKTLLQ